MSDDRQRLFFALWPDETVRERLAALGAPLLGTRARATAPENLHITLAFLGAVERARRPYLERAAAAIALPPFHMTLDRVGCWPRSGILWCAPARVPDALRDLHGALWAGLRACGFAAERRPFRAHATLARKFRGSVAGDGHAPISWLVEAFHLVRSRTLPAGARYEVVATWPLRGEPLAP